MACLTVGHLLEEGRGEWGLGAEGEREEQDRGAHTHRHTRIPFYREIGRGGGGRGHRKKPEREINQLIFNTKGQRFRHKPGLILCVCGENPHTI